MWPEDLEESRLKMANIIDKAIRRERGKAKKKRKKRRGELKRLKESTGSMIVKTAVTKFMEMKGWREEKLLAGEV